MGYKLFVFIIVFILGFFVIYKQLHHYQDDRQESLQEHCSDVPFVSDAHTNFNLSCACKHELDDVVVIQSLKDTDLIQQTQSVAEHTKDEPSVTSIVQEQVVEQSALFSKQNNVDNVPQLLNIKSENKIIEEQDMYDVCIALPDTDVLVTRLKKAGFAGLASNAVFLQKLSSKTFSSIELYEILDQELAQFKDAWVAHQRRGKLCNVIFQDYPDYNAYLKQREKINDNPKLYWKAAKLYAKKLQPQ